MKRILTTLSVAALFLSVACSNDEANTGKRAESEWNNYIQKHLIGEWKPKVVLIQNPLGEVLMEESFETLDQPMWIIRLDKDFTGLMTWEDQQRQIQKINFSWYHKFEELGVVLPKNLVLKASILEKSQEKLTVILSLASVFPYLDRGLPGRMDSLEFQEKDLEVVFEFVK